MATCVGPYAQHGEALLAACVRNASDYCDLTGEAPYIRRSIDAHHEAAKERGVRLVHCCGFDSVPSDIGAALVVRAAEEAGADGPLSVALLNGSASGGVSGGTVASAFGLFENESLETLQACARPYYLAEGEPGGDCGTLSGVGRVDGAWVGPALMAGINEPVVRRSASLLGWNLASYHERQATGKGFGGLVKALALSLSFTMGIAALAIGPLRRAIRRRLPAQGEGPDEEARESGFFKQTLIALDAGGKEVSRVRVRGNKDPGYGAAAVMLGECAVALARTRGTAPPPGSAGHTGGVLTPASAYGLGHDLADRLTEQGCVRFEVVRR